MLHSRLYVTCLEASLKKYIGLVVGASLKDGVWIAFFFGISTFVFGSINILANKFQLLFFVAVALVFSFIDERVSLKMKRWEYSGQMPRIFGVGVTPLLELAVTGVLTFLYVF